MIIEKQQAVINCLNTGRYIIKDDKIYNRKGKELFKHSLPTGYIQCVMYNGLRYGKGIKVICYKHIVIYLHNFGTYSPELVIGHLDNDNTNNYPNNLKAITQGENKLMSPNINNTDYDPIRAEHIEQIKELLKTTQNYSLIARTINKNRTSVMYIAKKLLKGEQLKYE